MSKIKILIVEDESIVAKDIQYSLEKLGYDVCGSVSNGEKAFDTAQLIQPDLVLMDIMLKGPVNGIETAIRLKEDFGIPVIFLTAYADQATLEKAKVAEPYGYIIKPFKEIDLQTSIEVAVYKHSKESVLRRERDYLYSIVENKEATNDIIFVKSNSKLIKLKTEDIYFIEALKDYVLIHTLDERYIVHSTMKDIEIKLGSGEFIRVHRSYIVRLDKIASIEYPNLTLEKDKKVIPIGGSYRDELNKCIRLV